MWKGIWSYLDLIPPPEELRKTPERIIWHWTGGGRANTLDRKHYHFIFDRPDGDVVVGDYTVDENMEWIDDAHYAAHTRGMNSFSVGMSFAGMLNARQGGHFGPYPLLRAQVENGLTFGALAAWIWGLDVRDPEHFHTHYEAQSLHGVKQNNKWDITELTWNSLGKDEVGDYLRTLAYERLMALFPDPSIVSYGVPGRKAALAKVLTG